MKRRVFLGTATGGFAALWPSSPYRLLAAQAQELPAGRFDAPDPAVLKLAGAVDQNGILGKVFPPKGVLEHRQIAPGGGYSGQWIWDTKFVVGACRSGGVQDARRETFDSSATWTVSG